MNQTYHALLRKLVFLLVHGIKASVLHIAKGHFKCAVLINPPDKAGGKLVHNGIFHKKRFPFFHLPHPFCAKRLFQTNLLIGRHRFQLLFQKPELRAGGLRLYGIVLLSGRREIFQSFFIFIIDLQLQRRR